MPARDSNGYDIPAPEVRDAFLEIFDLARAGALRVADSIAWRFDYDVEQTIDDLTGDTLIAIVERAPIQRGWGTILFRRGGSPVDVHVNHPLFDINTPRVAGDLFTACRCRALVMAGTHRYANGGEASDMARSTTSVFEGVHERLAPDGVMAVSVHGFSKTNYAGPTASSDVVLSNGATPGGELVAASATLDLRRSLNEQDFVAGHVAADPGYVYLTATSNPQGVHSNASFGGGRWTHIEIERSIRNDPALRTRLVGVIAAWIEHL